MRHTKKYNEWAKEEYRINTDLHAMTIEKSAEHLDMNSRTIIGWRKEFGLSKDREPTGLVELYPFPPEVIENNRLMMSWR